MKGTLQTTVARETDHRRTIDFGLWQAGLLRYVGQDPHYVHHGNGARDKAWEAKVPGPSATPHPQVTQRLSLAAGKITEP